MTQTHKISYVAFEGDVPEGMHVCHTCDEPLCVNPAHLWIGTASDNQKDRVTKKRFVGEESHASKLTELEVIEIYWAKDTLHSRDRKKTKAA